MEKYRKTSLIDRTAQLVERGSPAMARAAIFIAQNAEQVVRSSLAEVSRACGTGESTVIRLCQALGFDGFADFKLALAGEIERERVLHGARGKPSGDVNGTGRDARLDEIAGELMATVQRSAAGLDPKAIAQLAMKLRRAHRVIAYGVSLSGVSAEVLAARLAYLGIIVHVPRSGELALAATATLGPDDIAIGISYNGLSEETVAFLEQARARGAEAYALTTQGTSPLAKSATIVLELSLFGAWPKDGSARLLPSMILLTEYVATLIEQG